MDAHEFHREQYKMLREEIMQNMREMYRTEIVTVIAVVSVYTWLLSHDQVAVLKVAWVIPPCVIILGIFRCLDLTMRINSIAKFLLGIEKTVLGHDAKSHGWEHFKATKRGLDRIALIFAAVGWLFAFTVSIIATVKLMK